MTTNRENKYQVAERLTYGTKPSVRDGPAERSVPTNRESNHSTTRYKSDAFEAIRASASALRKVGGIDKAIMRQFDKSCLSVPALFEPRPIKQLRESNRVSQPVFVRYLNTSESTVGKWETGAKRPSSHGAEALGHRAEAWGAGAGLSGGGWGIPTHGPWGCCGEASRPVP